MVLHARLITFLAAIGVVIACGTGSGPADVLDSGVLPDGGGPDGGHDAGSPDSGLPDASMPDASVPDASVPVCNGYVYCDDFESYDVDAGRLSSGHMLGPWQVQASPAATFKMTVDRVRAFSGDQSLHITFPPSQANGMLQQSAPAGLIPGNNLYGRFMFYFAADGTDAGPNLPLHVHSRFFMTSGLNDVADAGVAMEVAASGQATPVLGFNYWPPDHHETYAAGPTWTPNTWHCLQWALDGAGSTPAYEARMWLDGNPIVDVPPSKGWVFATPWTTFEFGFQTLQAETNAIDVSLDSFALSGERVPCP
jgi:hypothetical protein